MIFSDSLPIQFWVNGETFNQKEIWGLSRQDCYCHRIQCGDEITVQFKTPEFLVDGFDPAYKLVVALQDNSILGVLPIDYLGELVEGGHLFSLTFSMNDFAPCIDRDVAFRISRNVEGGGGGDPSDPRTLTASITDSMESLASTIKASNGITAALTDLIEQVASDVQTSYNFLSRTKIGGTIAVGRNFLLQYRINGGSWQLWGSTFWTQTTCEDSATYSIIRGSTVEFRCIRQSNNQPIFFTYAAGSSCPINNPTSSITPAITVNSALTYSFTAYVDNNSDYLDVP